MNDAQSLIGSDRVRRRLLPAEPLTSPQFPQRFADDRSRQQTTTSSLAARNNLLKAEIELLVDRVSLSNLMQIARAY